jgi:hypothetical protein
MVGVLDIYGIVWVKGVEISCMILGSDNLTLRRSLLLGFENG